MLRILTTLASLLILAGCEGSLFYSADLEVPDCSSVDQNLIDGRITDNMERCPIDYSDVLFINSPGGNLPAALAIADKVKLYGTKVHSLGECSSACVHILVSSHDRTMCNDHLLGFHQATTERGTEMSLERFRADPRIDYEKVEWMIRSTPNHQTIFLYEEFAVPFGLVDRVIDCA